jgi:hypothetical protein
MLILFDHGTPKGLIRALPGHTIVTAQSRGWDKLTNGALLNAAEEAALDLLLTTDRRIRYQQNLAGRKIAIVVLTGTTKWSRVRLHLERVEAVVNAATAGAMPRWKFRSSEHAPRPARRFSYALMFVIEADETLTVIACFHGSRDPMHRQQRA